MPHASTCAEPARAGASVDALLSGAYTGLCRVADQLLARERHPHTLDRTVLAHEAYLRLAGGDEPRFADRAELLAAAAVTIRRLLVEHARRRSRAKHGAGRTRVALDDVPETAPVRHEELVALDEALTELASHDPLKARVVELRYFAGLSVEETAEAMGISESTVVRSWRFARAWLAHRLSDRPGAVDVR